MPIYEYKCQKCDHVEEVLQKGTDPFYFEGRGCPNCGAMEMVRLMSLGSFHLKGGGWYSDGYSLKKDKNDNPT